MDPTRRLALLAAVSLVLFAASPPQTIASTTPFSIHWTAPGDDSLVGRATVYDVRYSNLPITASNFLQATQFTGVPAPAVSGSPESFVVSGLTDGVLFYIALKSADEAGNWSALSNLMTRPGQTTGIEPSGLTLSFSSPWPNPARESVRWAYSLPQADRVQVDVFDTSGRHVLTVADGVREAGRGELSWDLRDDRGGRVGAGVYFVKAQLGSTQWTKRLIVVH